MLRILLVQGLQFLALVAPPRLSRAMREPLVRGCGSVGSSYSKRNGCVCKEKPGCHHWENP